MPAALKCIAVDDEPPALKLIDQFVSRIPGLELVSSFDDAVGAAEFLRFNKVDILFIDINMPDISGIDLVKSLERKPFVIFITAHKKFAFDGFELEAVDYLLKPVEFTRFSKAVQKAITLLKGSQVGSSVEGSLFVRSEYRLIKIDFDTIECIEGLEDYIRIHITDSRPVLTLMTMKAVLEKLPKNLFLRIHRSYIVSTSKVASLLNKKLTLLSGKELPVSDSYISEVNEWFHPPK